ncbi:MAG: DUF1840 domain-containing protein [Nitrosomonas sp. PRO4]|nr:DUF1840 domain-containing protein [Nitrosomonas sp. PRO4]
MLVTFSTDAHADIIMFGEVALTMIKMMGHSKTVPGAILAKDVPEALSRLKAAMAAEADLPVENVDEDQEKDNDENHEPAVSLANRALPLISLLTAAAEAECNVMWK